MKIPVAFYRCEVCGKLVALLKSGGGQLTCCNQPMTKLVPNTTDASTEKHVPVATRKDGMIYVQVGSELHPMTPAHYIEWIAVVSEDGAEIIPLTPEDEPKAVFRDRENAEVYEYCNLHGLWVAEIK